MLPQKGRFKWLEDGTYHADIPSVHENEEGNCYFRKSASCVEVCTRMFVKICLNHELDALAIFAILSF